MQYEVGKGSYGSVYAVTSNQKKFALKISALNDGDAINSGIVREWIFVNSFIPSPNVCPVLQKWTDRRNSYLLMPLYDCDAKLYAKEYSRSYEEFSTVASRIQSGILQIHKQGWLHRDLKAENVYIRRDDVVIGDFNLVRFEGFCDPQSVGTSRVCTLWSRAPELILAEINGLSLVKAGTEIDAYSFGVLLLVLIRGDYLFGKHLRGAGNTDEIKYMNAILSFLGVDSEIREFYQLGSQVFKPLSSDSILEYIPEWPNRHELSAYIFGLLHPLPNRRRKIDTFSFHDFNVIASVQAKTKAASGRYGPVFLDTFTSSIQQLQNCWSLTMNKNMSMTISLQSLRTMKKSPVFRTSSLYNLLNMIHLIHRTKDFEETQICVSGRELLPFLNISPKLWELSVQIENQPFLCCILAAWIATRDDLPTREQLEESDISTAILRDEDCEGFFFKKANRSMLQSWRRLA